MRDEFDRLRRVVFDTNVEIDVLRGEGTDEATMRIERVLWPRLSEAHLRIVAVQPTWPAEWATCLGAWCDGWQLRLSEEHGPTRSADEALEWWGEDLGFLLGLDGARELRERRHIRREQRRERDADAVREARGIAASIVEFLGDATARDLFARLLQRGDADALYEKPRSGRG